MKPRPYQSQVIWGVEAVWRENGVPLVVLPPGGGKTFVFARLIKTHEEPAAALAHRCELVSQTSATLSRDGVRHKIIAPPATIRNIIHHRPDTLYSPTSMVAVVGVDSLHNTSETWRRQVTLLVIDEAHHVLRSNKWGRAIALFPNAKIVGVTATPCRADGRGLGAHADGVFTHLVEGPTMRELIDAGYLCDYRVCAPNTHIDTGALRTSAATGDYTAPSMRAAMSGSTIVGDVVSQYRRFANDQLGITFAINVAAAQEIAAAYCAADIPAVAISAKTPPNERADTLKRFAQREVRQLVNVDIFGEGFDLPAIEVVSFVRPTQSFPMYCQSFGRALRPLEGKTRATIIDHVDNVVGRHGLPDAPRVHSLDSLERKSISTASTTLKACPSCAGVFIRFQVTCPYCAFTPPPRVHSSPATVDGDLIELNAETLAALRGDITKVDQTSLEYTTNLLQKNCPPIGIAANVKRHRATQTAQARLRHCMDWWRGAQHAKGHNERESHRLFFITFGVDVLSAQSLPSTKADALYSRIHATLPFSTQCMS